MHHFIIPQAFKIKAKDDKTKVLMCLTVDLHMQLIKISSTFSSHEIPSVYGSLCKCQSDVKS